MRHKLFNFLFWAAILALGAGTILNLSPYGRSPAGGQKIQGSSRGDTPIPKSADISQALAASLDNATEKNSVENTGILEPVAEFQDRITKKPFGIYITPKTSPVQPDRFTGYHAGVDIEYGDLSEDIIVRAIADGAVIISKKASGYGGVIVVHHSMYGKNILALYGHLNPESMLKAGIKVRKGQALGFLGRAYSEETDGARKHLHFAILKENSPDLRGYVQNKEELDGWYDPIKFYKDL